MTKSSIIRPSLSLLISRFLLSSLFLTFFILLTVFVGCSTDESSNEPNIESKILNNIEEVLSQLPSPPQQEFQKIEIALPPCRLVEERFSASYETANTTHLFYYESGLLSKVEYYNDKILSSYVLYSYENDSHVKVYSEHSIILDEFIYKEGLLSKRIFYDDGELQGYGYYFYDKRLLNRSLIANVNGEVLVVDHNSDKYGNITESWVVWEKDGAPLKDYYYTSKYDTNFLPYIGLLGEFGNEDLWGTFNEIESQVFIDGKLREDNVIVTLTYDEYGFVKTRTEDNGTFHYFSYYYECD